MGRPYCEGCRRPLSTCWCSVLPPKPVCLRARIPYLQRILVFMHPNELSRAFSSVPVIQRCCDTEDIIVTTTRKANEEVARSHIQNSQPVVLFPRFPLSINSSENDTECISVTADSSVSIIVLDGTWSECKSILHKSQWLQGLPRLSLQGRSEGLFKGARRAKCFAPTVPIRSTAEAIVDGLFCLSSRVVPPVSEAYEAVNDLSEAVRACLIKISSIQNGYKLRKLVEPTTESSNPGERCISPYSSNND
eukprot:GHVU01115476.1.p1 GENE.GHVU01115476.1~~GHVU01115476.1.p1  ORF type:complete len:249 (+),score=6.35 GHVU01115476.1:292-1038(+)